MSISHHACEEAQQRHKLEGASQVGDAASQVGKLHKLARLRHKFARPRHKLATPRSIAPGVRARVRVGALGLQLKIQLLVWLVTYIFKTCFMFFHSERDTFHVSKQYFSKRFMF